MSADRPIGRGTARPHGEHGPRGRSAQVDVERLRLELIAAQGRLAEQDVLIREVDHRARNALQLAAGLLGAQARKSADGCVRHALSLAARRLYGIATAHTTSSSGPSTIALDGYLRGVCKAVVEGGGLGGDVRLELEIEDHHWPADVVSALGLFVNEAVTNALKYAFPDRDGGRIVVAMTRVDDADVQLDVSDDGIGILPAAGAGLGGQIMQALAQRLRGGLLIETGPGRGAKVSLRFPAPGQGA